MIPSFPVDSLRGLHVGLAWVAGWLAETQDAEVQSCPGYFTCIYVVKTQRETGWETKRWDGTERNEIQIDLRSLCMRDCAFHYYSSQCMLERGLLSRGLHGMADGACRRCRRCGSRIFELEILGLGDGAVWDGVPLLGTCTFRGGQCGGRLFYRRCIRSKRHEVR